MDKYRNKYRIGSTRMQNWDYGWNGSYFITICTHNRICYFGRVQSNIMHLSDLGNIAQKCWQEIPDHFPFIQLSEFVVMPNHVHGIITINKPRPEFVRMDNDRTADIGGIVDIDATGDIGGIVDIDATGDIGGIVDIDATGDIGGIVDIDAMGDIGGIVDIDATGDIGGIVDIDAMGDIGGIVDIDATGDIVETQNFASLRRKTISKNKFGPQSQNMASIIRGYKTGVTKFARTTKRDFQWQGRFWDHVIRDRTEFIRIKNYIINNPANWDNDKFHD